MFACTKLIEDLSDADDLSRFLSEKKYAPDSLKAEAHRKSIQYETRTAASETFSVSKTAINGNLVIRPETNWNWHLFILSERGDVHCRERNQWSHGNPRTAIAFDGTDCERACYQDNQMLSLAVKPEVLTHHLSIILGVPVEDKIVFEQSMNLYNPALQSLVSISNCFVSDTNIDLLTGSPAIAKQMSHLLIEILLTSWPHSQSHKLRICTHPSRRSSVQRAVDLIEADPMAISSVPDLAETCGVSVRALQYGFEKHLEIRPAEYLRNVRLKRAREDLLSQPHQSIGVIARRWGFLNPGRFSEYFRNFYKVSPSELRRGGR